MKEKTIITGITVKEQIEKAKLILDEDVIPRDKEYTKIKKMEKKTSQEWYELIPKEKRPVIYDPDGWDRTNYKFSFFKELITHEEFENRLSRSTCVFHPL